MRKFITGCILALGFVGVVYAGCYTNNVITPDGRMMVCTTCCYEGSGCTTTCSQ